MWFKNLLVFRFKKPFEQTVEQLEDQLQEFSFTPCGSQDISKIGFTKAFGKHGHTLVHSSQNQHLIAVTKEEKILPASVIKEALEEKVAHIEQAEARSLHKKEKDSLKDEIIHTLLPRAFSKRATTKALILPQHDLLLVDASSASKADEVLSLLRKAVGSLPILPAQYNSAIEAKLTEWLQQGHAPTPFEMLDEAELKAEMDDGGIVKFKQQALTEDEVLAHIEAGKQVHKVSLSFADSTQFLLQSDGAIKRVKFSEDMRSENQDSEDPAARMDADYSIMCAELGALMAALFEALDVADIHD
ncbi:recombination-associated protein RdgC [Paraferrimonas sedimenticola]|uniref:Recombination-associated protein RdgC n=1 Tax=Paraferrimonas sedimenticola TaxID=375674 RepID=A0AA37RSM8_9GAMM|nr:recombination-associated protein RdgC [Paraferrimonas sedimenticola]GLP95220.1 recombination-associated protein RdgC [Paraferrimonas sedimenticola]